MEGVAGSGELAVGEESEAVGIAAGDVVEFTDVLGENRLGVVIDFAGEQVRSHYLFTMVIEDGAGSDSGKADVVVLGDRIRIVDTQLHLDVEVDYLPYLEHIGREGPALQEFRIGADDFGSGCKRNFHFGPGVAIGRGGSLYAYEVAGLRHPFGLVHQ